MNTIKYQLVGYNVNVMITYHKFLQTDIMVGRSNEKKSTSNFKTDR